MKRRAVVIDITVIIPIYNVEKYLTECLLSVEKLSKQVNMEVLLIDDGSTDRSAAIAQEFCENNSIFRYMRTEHKGVSAARNLGLDNASGEFVMFVDADDIIVPEVYKEMVNIAVSNNLSLVRCYYVRTQNGTVSHSAWGSRAMSDMHMPIVSLEDNPNLVYDTPSWNKIIRRNIFEENNIRYPEGVVLNEDAPVMLKVFYYSGACATYFRTGYLWRIRTENDVGSSTQNTHHETALFGKLKTTEDCLEFCKKEIIDTKVYKKVLWKFLSVELPELLSKFQQLDEEEAGIRINQIKDFLSRYDASEIMDTLPIVSQQMITDIKEGRTESVVRVANFKIAALPSCPVIYNRDDEAEMVIPEALFSEDRTPANKEFTDTTPTISVTSAEVDDDRMLLHGHLFMNRVETSKDHPQSIEAFLLGCKSNRRINLESDIEYTRYLSEQKGTDICSWDFSSHKYDYDYGGFKICLDSRQILKSEIENGEYSLHIGYQNRICSGAIAVRGVSADAKEVMKKWRVASGGRQAKIWIDRSGIAFIRIEEGVKSKTQVQPQSKDKKKTKSIVSLPIGRRYRLSLTKKNMK